jgi:hypothetical protein
MAIDSLTRGIVNKILHPPIAALKNASGTDQLATTAESVRNLFGLEDVHIRRNGNGIGPNNPSEPRAQRQAAAAACSELQQRK